MFDFFLANWNVSKFYRVMCKKILSIVYYAVISFSAIGEHLEVPILCKKSTEQC